METAINNTAPKSLNQDPRIDSPQIKVVYPSSTVVLRPKDPIKPVEKEIVQNPTNTTTNTIASPIDSSGQTRTETHVCTISWQNAIKQNASVFLLLGAGILAIGYFLGKNKG